MSLQTRTRMKKQESAIRQLMRALCFRYHCSFCPDELKRNRLTLNQAILWVFGFRHHHCPHCFEESLRPVSWLKILLFPAFVIRQTVRWIFNRH